MKAHDVRGSGAISDLVVEVFRLNGVLLAEGDRLTRDLGLTSARWQALGALELSGRPLTVSQISRAMGLTRQSVARIIKELETDAFVKLADNPDHQKAKLVTPTAMGHRAFQAAMRRQTQWASHICETGKLGISDIRGAISTLHRIRAALQKGRDS